MTLLSLCSGFVLCGWAEVGFSGERWIWCGRDVHLPWWPSGQSICPKRGTEAPRLAPPGARFALMCFWGGPAGASLQDALQHPPFLPPCCALRAQEQPASLGQGCHHSGTPPSSTRCPPHSVMPGHPALSASPDKTQVIYGGGSNFPCQKSHFLQPGRAQGTSGLHWWGAEGPQCCLASLLMKMKGPKPL